MVSIDEKYILKTIKLAEKATEDNEVPVGAIIVKDNKIISKARNRREKSGIVTRHAEIIAIERAERKLGDWRLNGCVLYTSLSPCQMCLEVIKESRIDRVVYAAKDERKNKKQRVLVESIKNKTIAIKSTELLKSFFKKKR